MTRPSRRCTERVTDELAPGAGEEQERFGHAEELAVEFSVLAPPLLVAHIRRKLRHRRAVDVVDRTQSGSSEEMSASELRTSSTGSGLNDATAPWLLLSIPQTDGDQVQPADADLGDS